MSTTSHPHELTLTRIVNVPVHKVWAAWTVPEQVCVWFCPKPWFVSECEIDLRPGGIFRTVMNGPGGERFDSSGCYLEVTPNQRLVWTDALQPGYAPSEKPWFTGIIELEDLGNGQTRYTARALHATAQTCEDHAKMGFHDGWGKALDQLVEMVLAG